MFLPMKEQMPVTQYYGINNRAAVVNFKHRRNAGQSSESVKHRFAKGPDFKVGFRETRVSLTGPLSTGQTLLQATNCIGVLEWYSPFTLHYLTKSYLRKMQKN